MTEAKAEEYTADQAQADKAQMSDEELAVALGAQDPAHQEMLRRYIGKDLFERTVAQANTSR